MEVYLEFLNNQVLISSLFWINWKGEKWLETVQTKNVEACCEESNVLKTCDVVEVVGNFGFGLKKWTEIWRKTSSWHDIWPEIVRNCGSFSKFLMKQVLILSLFWFKNAKSCFKFNNPIKFQLLPLSTLCNCSRLLRAKFTAKRPAAWLNMQTDRWYHQPPHLQPERYFFLFLVRT